MSPLLLVVIALLVLAALVVWVVWQSARPDKTATWPVTEGTIQSVGTVVVSAGRSSYSIDVADFFYIVTGEYYSGRLTVGHTYSSEDASARSLISSRFQLRYDPLSPENFSILQAQLGRFSLTRYNDSGSDIDPIDLNIDKL